MTDLPAGQRDELVSALLPNLMTPLRTLQADKGKTVKTLWKLFDGALVESVLMRYPGRVTMRSEEHTSELQSLMRISYAVFCLKKKKINTSQTIHKYIAKSIN